MEAHDHISVLDDSKNSWNLKVRVTRIWVTRYRSVSRTGSVFRHNMILLDSLNNQIAAVVYPELWEKIRNILVEGRVYTIIDVRVNNATGDFMPVPNQRILMLTNSTTITPHVQDTGIIPFHRFNYKTIPELDGLVRGNGHVVYRTFSIDVIGLLEDLQPLQKVQTIDGLEDVVKFRIYDGSNSCYVTHWGPMNMELNQAYNDVIERPVVVILAGFKLSRIDGVVRLSNMESSRIYLNLNHSDVFSFRNRFG